MRNKLFLIFFLMMPISFLTFWTLNLQSESFEKEVQIAAEGFDPRDFLSGRYINLRLNWQKTNCAQFPAEICPQKAFEKTYHFYVPEDKANRLEKLIETQNPSMMLVFGYKEGQTPRLKNLLINNLPWEEALTQF